MHVVPINEHTKGAIFMNYGQLPWKMHCDCRLRRPYIKMSSWIFTAGLVVVYKVNFSFFFFFFESKMSPDLVPATIYSPLLG